MVIRYILYKCTVNENSFKNYKYSDKGKNNASRMLSQTKPKNINNAKY